MEGRREGGRERGWGRGRFCRKGEGCCDERMDGVILRARGRETSA